jgi:hypothetical protein
MLVSVRSYMTSRCGAYLATGSADTTAKVHNRTHLSFFQESRQLAVLAFVHCKLY